MSEYKQTNWKWQKVWLAGQRSEKKEILKTAHKEILKGQSYVDMHIVVVKKYEDLLNTHQRAQESIRYRRNTEQPSKQNYSASRCQPVFVPGHSSAGTMDARVKWSW